MLKGMAALALCALLAGDASTSEPLWIERPAAIAWLPALQAAANRTGLPVELIAELIGAESGFQNVKNSRSSARGCGQQIDRNPYIARYHLDRSKCDQSILAAALQLRDALDQRGALEPALISYGTLHGMTPARRKRLMVRFNAAAGRFNQFYVAQPLPPLIQVNAVKPKPARIVR